MTALRNPAHPQALTVDDVLPDVSFVCYNRVGGQWLYAGCFTATPENGRVAWVSLSAGAHRNGFLTDLGIIQRIGDNGPFWTDAYCLRA